MAIARSTWKLGVICLIFWSGCSAKKQSAAETLGTSTASPRCQGIYSYQVGDSEMPVADICRARHPDSQGWGISVRYNGKLLSDHNSQLVVKLRINGRNSMVIPLVRVADYAEGWMPSRNARGTFLPYFDGAFASDYMTPVNWVISDIYFAKVNPSTQQETGLAADYDSDFGRNYKVHIPAN